MKPRRKVLVIGMLDSIHVARWLEQFQSEDICFTLFPSRRFRKIHSRIIQLIKGNGNATYNLAERNLNMLIYPYLDFFLSEVLSKSFERFSRSSRLAESFSDNNFDYVHALELQGSGYLLGELPANITEKSELILTNWGSDIYYYKNLDMHKETLSRILTLADRYSAECIRDYSLAREMGFHGLELPCIPNAGGFAKEYFTHPRELTSSRSQVIIKGYEGLFGRASLVIQLIPELSKIFPHVRFLIYSATPDATDQVNKFSDTVKSRVKVFTVKNKISHQRIMNEFFSSRVYVGSSISDGVSTSFLEALISGAYPIQTNSSCADEWVAKGCLGTLVSPDSREIFDALKVALSDDEFVDSAAKRNFQIAQAELDYEVIRKQALNFYERTSD